MALFVVSWLMPCNHKSQQSSSASPAAEDQSRQDHLLWTEKSTRPERSLQAHDFLV